MVHISKYKVRAEVYERVNDLFYIVMSKLKTKKMFAEITKELFSSTEKVMFMKRIATIYMILRGAEYRDVSRTLHVSTSTVSKFSLLFKEKESKIAKLINNLQASESVVNLLDDLVFNLFNQRGFKKGHWQEYWEYEKRKNKRKIMGT